VSKGNIARSLNKLESRIDDIRKDAHKEFVRVTPIRTGNARRNTDLKGKEIQANYGYAVKLEKDGWSRQAPQGMSEPTIDYVKTQVRMIVG
jgi:hypothetical protein